MKRNRYESALTLGSGCIDPAFELPSTDEFVCSDEEVREACEALCADDNPEVMR